MRDIRVIGDRPLRIRSDTQQVDGHDSQIWERPSSRKPLKLPSYARWPWHWEHEFDTLCTLLANSLVVHTDETSWSINSV
ncbi:MAG: hypothetical protein ABSG43_31120, partial [Solirubrobacteraceae bacterium]